MPSTPLNIINVPSDVGSIYAGKSKAPSALRSAGLQEKLTSSGFQISEYAAFEQGEASWASSSRAPNGGRNETRTVSSCKKVKDTVLDALNNHGISTFQLILAGECLYCPAILSAYWHHLEHTQKGKRIGMIYIDADVDLYTPSEQESSGNIAGMTLTHMTLREGALESMKQFSRPDGTPVVDNTNIALFGTNVSAPVNLRSHLGYLFDNNFNLTTSPTVQASPIASAEKVLRWMEDRVDYIIVHLDVDVIDPGEFPLCNVPNWTGLGFEECMGALRCFLGSGKCVGLSVAEVNPDHDPGLGMTKKLVDRLVEGLRGKVGA